MIERYTVSPLDAIWEPRHLPLHWRLVASNQVRARFGDGPFTQLMRSDVPTWSEVQSREAATGHDVVAFLDTWRAMLPTNLARLVHLGLTSSDLVDTTNALHMVESSKVIEFAIQDLIFTLANLSLKHWDVPRLGRTHGQPAEATTFGYQLARVVGSLLSSHDRFSTACEDIALVKMSGAVGGYRWTTPEQEVRLAQALGPEYSGLEIAGQRVPRDGYARWVSELALLATVLEDLLLQVRLGQQWEIGELAEGRPQTAVGSSAMPHKTNPIRSETMTGLARLVRAQIIPVMEGIPTWSERDITHSSVERVALRTASTLVHYMLFHTNKIMESLQVDAGRMLVNLNSAQDRIRSSHYLVELVEHTDMSPAEARTLIRDLLVEGDGTIGDRIFGLVPGLESKIRHEPSMDISHAKLIMEEVLGVSRDT